MAPPVPSNDDPQGRPKFSNFTLSAMLAAEVATGVPALAMLHQTHLLPSPPPHAKILDNACGAGVVAKQLFHHLATLPANDENNNAAADLNFELTCGDIDGTMEQLTADLIAEKGWSEQNVSVRRIDAHSTGYPEGTFSHVLMNFGPQLMRDAKGALKETYRVLQDGGVAGFTCWVRTGWLPGVVAVFPNFEAPGLLQTYPWKEPRSIEGILGEIGFVDVVVREHDFTTRLSEGGVDGFLELMALLMPGLLNGENMQKYERYMKAQVEKQPVLEMSWQALIVSARKP
jgi:SAM-dependent methyltransferase